MNTQNPIHDSFLLENSIQQYSHFAMNTSFKFYLQNEDKNYSEQAANEGFKLIDLLEEELSKFRPNSEITRINNAPLNFQMIVSEDTFNCLRECKTLFELTNNKFDITAGKKINRYKNNSGMIEQVNSSLKTDGSFPILLDESNYSIRVTSPLELDLGGFGKGYALDKVKELFLEWGVESFLLSGGSSSLLAGNSSDGISAWPLSISRPGTLEILIDNILLRSYSLSGSGLQKGSHIINPITGATVKRTAAWSACGSAAWSDAFSTAFMIMDRDEIETICDNYDISALIIDDEDVFTAGKFFKG